MRQAFHGSNNQASHRNACVRRIPGKAGICDVAVVSVNQMSALAAFGISVRPAGTARVAVLDAGNRRNGMAGVRAAAVTNIDRDEAVVSDEKPLQSHEGRLETPFAWKPLVEPGIRANV